MSCSSFSKIPGKKQLKSTYQAEEQVTPTIRISFMTIFSIRTGRWWKVTQTSREIVIYKFWKPNPNIFCKKYKETNSTNRKMGKKKSKEKSNS